MKMPFLLISPKIVPKIQLIKKGGCFEYHAVIADKIEYRYIHRASICPASGMDRRSFFMPKTMGKYKSVDCQVKLTHFFVEFFPTLVTDKAEY